MAYDNKLFMQELRHQRRDKKLCIDCGQVNDQYPKWTCKKCSQKRNRRARKYRINKKLG